MKFSLLKVSDDLPKILVMKMSYQPLKYLSNKLLPLFVLQLIFVFSMPSIFAREIIFDDGDIFDELVENQIEEVMQSLEGNARSEDIRSLKMAKLALINGNTKEAQFHLNRINEFKSKIGVIKKRYQAIIAFVENDYKSSVEALNQLQSMRSTDSGQYCLLKLIAHMGLNDQKGLQKEQLKCLFESEPKSKNELFWLNSMLNLYNQKTASLNRDLYANAEKILGDPEVAKLWLKINLYLNRETDALKTLISLPETAYESYKVRELIAFMYFRTKNYERAMSFIEDIDSVNAENIKGNIRIIDKAYELAFGHFKLALQKKADSINALEKGIPLAWILGQWNDGITMLNNVSGAQITDARTKKALQTAFQIRLKDFKNAKNNLLELRNDFQNAPPSEVLIMESYLSLIDANKKEIEDKTEASCKSFDGMSCYLAAQTIMWNNLGHFLKENKDTEITETKNDFNVDQLRVKNEDKPLEEEVFIDQRDIEELDSVDAFNNGLVDF